MVLFWDSRGESLRKEVCDCASISAFYVGRFPDGDSAVAGFVSAEMATWNCFKIKTEALSSQCLSTYALVRNQDGLALPTQPFCLIIQAGYVRKGTYVLWKANLSTANGMKERTSRFGLKPCPEEGKPVPGSENETHRGNQARNAGGIVCVMFPNMPGQSAIDFEELSCDLANNRCNAQKERTEQQMQLPTINVPSRATISEHKPQHHM